MNEREPFLLLAKEAASRLLESRVRPKETAYQFFMSDKCEDERRNHPHMSLPELTQQVLAPMWNRLTAEERAPYEDKASKDAKRWMREQERDRDTSGRAEQREVLESVKSQAEVIASGHLSGAGLFAAANFDARTRVQDQADVMQMWTQLDDAQQRPWKEKALANQKNFALKALTKSRVAASSTKKKKTSKRERQETNEE